MTKQLEIPFIKKTQITHDIYSFFFRRPPDFNFLPGQYLRMILHHDSSDDKGSSRFFTIASSPLEKYIMITTKLRESTFKRELLNIKIGQNVLIFGPIGNFYLDDDLKDPVVFIAGGMGITPYYSMIKYLHKKRIKTHATLLAYFKNIEDRIFYDDLIKITDKNKFINVIYIITGNYKDNDSTNGERGRLSGGLIKKYIPNFIKSKYYITGPELMVDSGVVILKDLGIPTKNIAIEKFTGY